MGRRTCLVRTGAPRLIFHLGMAATALERDGMVTECPRRDGLCAFGDDRRHLYQRDETRCAVGVPL